MNWLFLPIPSKRCGAYWVMTRDQYDAMYMFGVAGWPGKSDSIRVKIGDPVVGFAEYDRDVRGE